MTSPYFSLNDIFLKELKVNDVTNQYLKCLNLVMITKYIESRFSYQDIKKVQSFVWSFIEDEPNYPFRFLLNKNIKLIQNIRLYSLKQKHTNSEIGLFISYKTLWCKVYAAKSIYLAAQFAFNELKLNKLRLLCYENNIGSNAGFFKYGVNGEGFLKYCVESPVNKDDDWRLGFLSSEILSNV